MNRIPFCAYDKLFSPYVEDILKVTRSVVERGSFIMGQDLRDLELAIAKKVNIKHAVGVGNATDGLEMLIAAHSIPKGAEVLVSAHTMAATASAVVACGGKAVPVDIDVFGMMDPVDLERHITKNTWAIMPTQLNGAICQIDRIMEIANEYGLKVFEDSAQAFSASLSGRFAGSFGCGGVFSFYPAKILGCLGDGGVIVTNDSAVYGKLLALRDHGRTQDGDVISAGRNSRLDNLQAAYLNYFLENHFEGWISHRRVLTELYDQELSKFPNITVPCYNFRPKHRSVFQNYEFLADNRDELESWLRNGGVSTLRQWSGKAINHLTEFENNQRLPNVEKYFQKYLMLPLNHTVSVDQAHQICRLIGAFYDKNRS